MNRQTQPYWNTRDLHIAAYLFARNCVIVGIEATEHKVIFTFIDSLERQKAMDEFRTGKPLIDVRIYICALQTLKHKALDALIENHGGNR